MAWPASLNSGSSRTGDSCIFNLSVNRNNYLQRLRRISKRNPGWLRMESSKRSPTGYDRFNKRSSQSTHLLNISEEHRTLAQVSSVHSSKTVQKSHRSLKLAQSHSSFKVYQEQKARSVSIVQPYLLSAGNDNKTFFIIFYSRINKSFFQPNQFSVAGQSQLFFIQLRQ